MNIGDITNGGFSTAKHLKPHRNDKVTEHAPRIGPASDRSDDRQEAKDSIAISEEARLAHAAEQKRLQEFEAARQALDAQASLSPQRRQEILDRLKTGFYSNPDASRHISSRILDELGG